MAAFMLPCNIRLYSAWAVNMVEELLSVGKKTGKSVDNTPLSAYTCTGDEPISQQPYPPHTPALTYPTYQKQNKKIEAVSNNLRHGGWHAVLVVQMWKYSRDLPAVSVVNGTAGTAVAGTAGTVAVEEATSIEVHHTAVVQNSTTSRLLFTPQVREIHKHQQKSQTPDGKKSDLYAVSCGRRLQDHGQGNLP